MALSAFFVEDHTTRIVSITMTGRGDQQFLYSDAGGMFASRDGIEWKPLDNAVPATAMAYGDGVWIATGGDAMWRSEDGAATWEPVAAGTPALWALAFIKPGPPHPPDQPGVFAGAAEEDSVIYASFDLGKTWGQVYTGAANDSVNPSVLSGCGGKFFLATQEYDYDGHMGSGYAHVSTDGLSWSRISVFPGGTDAIDGDIIGDSQLARLTDSIAFDEQAGLYYAIGWEAYSHINDTRTNIIYATSSDGLSFGGGGLVYTAYSSTETTFRDYLQPGAVSAAAGLNTFATAFTYYDISVAIRGTVKATVGPGGNNLFPISEVGAAARNVRFCNGAFVCTAFDGHGAGGTFTSTGGGWEQTHSGTPIFGLEAGLAVGRIAQSGVNP